MGKVPCGPEIDEIEILVDQSSYIIDIRVILEYKTIYGRNELKPAPKNWVPLRLRPKRDPISGIRI
jgi:hypothetical protein